MKKLRIGILFLIIMVTMQNLLKITSIAAPKTRIITELENLHNGDAKFYRNQIVTSIGGKLAFCNLRGECINIYDEIEANWIDAIGADGVVVYGNFDKEIGIARFDKENQLLSNKVIMKTKNLQIDPTITKVKNKYYITVTEVEGKVNNAEEDKKNGIYTIHLYQSSDLVKWNYVDDVIRHANNLEDVDVKYQDNRFLVFYEKEEMDKGESSLCFRMSKDAKGSKWCPEKTIMKADCDHEPAVINQLKDGYRIYYSSDKANPGESYMGGHIYYMELDEQFRVEKKDVKIQTATQKGILLYDVRKNKKGQRYFLYAKDYMTDCDLMVEKDRKK